VGFVSTEGFIMCGRFTLVAEIPELQKELELGDANGDWNPKYNIAPSQKVPVVMDVKERTIEFCQWGLIPFWAKDPSIGNRMINARMETLSEKPAFQQAFKSRHCLILADGFYEWQHTGTKRTSATPYYFRLKSEKPFAFAGLWDSWNKPDGESLKTCAIITCPPNEIVSRVHERMPVILNPENYWDWLSQNTRSEFEKHLVPFDSSKMIGFPVGKMINNPKYDSKDCIEPLKW
jgi:putative SOS response-associated peptidase YedK